MHRVFVYGSLKRGFENHDLLGAAVFTGKAITAASFRMMDGPYPVLRESGAGRFRVSGELYEVDDRTLAALDDLEGVAERFYDRLEIDVVMAGEPSAEKVRAFAYIGCADYWDRQPQSSYVTQDAEGHLDWTPPQSR
jgi:gamma-glutamylaminecyclotransferase